MDRTIEEQLSVGFKSRIMRRSIYGTFCLLFFTFMLSAQPRIDLGFAVGGSNYLGDLVETSWPFLKETNPMFGMWSTYRIGKTGGLRLGAAYGKVSGDDQNFSDPVYSENRRFRFTTDLLELSLVGVWEPFGKRRYPSEVEFKKIFSPYIFGGIGVVRVMADPDFSDMPTNQEARYRERIQTDKRDLPENLIPTFPMGVGFKQDLSKRSVISVELGFRKAMTDYIDGISEAGNPGSGDWYVFGGTSLSFRIGEKDSDDDGIPDKEDACPVEPGNLSARGCPDQDGDGIEDLEDICPGIPGVYELSGCPDSDGDKVADRFDLCPDVPGKESTQGCPDLDGDGFRDDLDECPGEAGTKLLLGCPDCDGDGIGNASDECPTVAGTFEFNGCPFADADKDGVPDEDDRCPEVAGTVYNDGCPDTDNDWVVDIDDRCPETPGLRSNAGCPPLPEEAKTILEFATRNIKFETGSAKLKQASLKTLDEIAGIMEEYDYYQLTISGHTDSRGKDALNLKLSKERAEACFDYLVKQGVDPERMIHDGFGETQPIGDNRTAAGRQKNRRVTFDLSIE
ncbi:hypothetical protein CRP01_05590 [Flavilitoribacter nigricans DSM 23189 = NBRC 102662]|uniref:OmpA-like domain-containing protein n=2 Tax=Flavilitoribacter TaxID=2762562 RepID=A0A2D0NGE2_FLAN2|nr:hypothetical protein CRP01_05590 [Flavilitoribacter nigricans DSM 23189 = NBRC 102662]